MADNFDLRQFLTENKLTKNAQLLNEAVTLDGKPVDVGSIEIDGIDTSDYPDFVDAYITYAEFEDGTPLSEDELMRLEDENYGIVGELIFDKQLYLEGKEVEEGIQSQPGLEGVNYGSIEIDGVDSNDYPDFVDAYVAYAEFEDGTPLSEEELYQLTDELYESGELADMAAESLYEGKEKELKEGKSYKVSKNSKEAQHLKKGDIIGSGDEVVSVSAGAKTPSGKVEVTLKTKDGKTKTSTWGKTTKVGVKEKETVKENKMTQRDKYLTRLVENALGLEGYGDDNVNRQREKQGLPPAQGPKYSEGITEDEIAKETVIPEYSSIDELMKSIDHGTNKVAEEHKIQEMKKIAEALRMKAKNMEESEHAAHISPKDLKQLATDAAKLEKAAEKLKAAFDKKFNKKTKSASAPKAEKEETPVALAEGFDLKKFLVENKLTSNSRMLSENEEQVDELFGFGGNKGSNGDCAKLVLDTFGMPGEAIVKKIGGKLAIAPIDSTETLGNPVTISGIRTIKVGDFITDPNSDPNSDKPTRTTVRKIYLAPVNDPKHGKAFGEKLETAQTAQDVYSVMKSYASFLQPVNSISATPV